MKKASQSKKAGDISSKKSRNSFTFHTGIAGGLLIGFLVAFIPQHINFKPAKISPTPALQVVHMKTFILPTPIRAKIATPPAALKMPIMMYHYVEAVADPRDIIRQRLDIIPSHLDKQLKNLSDNEYTTVFVKDIPQFINGTQTIPQKPIALTFDDGYEDFYIHAFPLLKKYNMKATIYIIYDFIGRKGFLTQAEIQTLLDSGLIEVGSHTLDHLDLAHISLNEAHKQIVESKNKLETMFNIKIETFAYPSGKFDKQVVEITKEASYSAAVSVMPGIDQTKADLFTLYRLRPERFPDGDVAKGLQEMK